MRTTTDGLVEIEYSNDDNNKFTFKSDGKDFMIPGLTVDQTTGNLVASSADGSVTREFTQDDFAKFTKNANDKTSQLQVPSLDLVLNLKQIDPPKQSCEAESKDTEGSDKKDDDKYVATVKKVDWDYK